MKTVRTRRLAVAMLGLAGLLLVGCKSKSPLDQLSDRIRSGDQTAFREVLRLESPEDQVQLIPALIDAYNSGHYKEDVVGILVDIGDPGGTPVFVSALEDPDPLLSGLAARGLAKVGADEHAGAIATRLAAIRDPRRYEPFLEALSALPGHPEVAPVVANIIKIDARRHGIIRIVMDGCEILGRSNSTDPETIDALVFGLVNLIPQGAQDPVNQCVLALVHVGEPAVGKVVETFLGQNLAVNEHVIELGYTVEAAELRAARALSEMASPTALDDVITWFSTPHEIPSAQLQLMSAEDLENWWRNTGQIFWFATDYLAYVGGERAHETLRRLVNRGENSLLANFQRFMGTREDVELGLRVEAIKGLLTIGDVADKEIFFEIATSGTLLHLIDALIQKEGAHAFALMSQAGDMERFETYIDGIERPDLRAEVESYLGMVQVAEDCPDHRVDCLAERLTHEDWWVREKAVYDLVHFAENEAAAAAAIFEAMSEVDPDTRLLFARSLRGLTLPQTGPELIDQAIEASGGGMNRDVRYELRILRALNYRE